MLRLARLLWLLAVLLGDLETAEQLTWVETISRVLVVSSCTTAVNTGPRRVLLKIFSDQNIFS